MSLRQFYGKIAANFTGDSVLLKIVQSELSHELSSHVSPPPSSQLRNFVVSYDNPRTQDVVLKRETDAEEIAVSGLIKEGSMREDVLMKVCVKKFGFDPILCFHCKLGGSGGFAIRTVDYFNPVCELVTDSRKGSSSAVGCLDPSLQKSLKEYLLSRGIDGELTDFLKEYLLNKEQKQYIAWLHTLEGFIAKKDS